MSRRRIWVGAVTVALALSGGLIQVDRWAPRWDIAILAVAVVIGWVPGVVVALSTAIPHVLIHHDAWSHFGTLSIFLLCGTVTGAVLRWRSATPTLPYRTALRLVVLAVLTGLTALVQTLVDSEVTGLNGWTEEFVHISVGVTAAALVVWLPWREARATGLFGPTLSLMVSLSLTLLIAGYWTNRDQQLLRLTADSTAFGFLNSLSDEVNVIATKAGTSTDTEFTPDNFNSLMQTVVFGHEPITGAALLERGPAGTAPRTTAVSDFGPEFEAGLVKWVNDPSNSRLAIALAADGVSFVGFADLPVPAGGLQPHFVYYAPLEAAGSTDEVARSIVATVSIPILLSRSLSLALGSDNEVTVTLYELGMDSQRAVWTSNSDISAQRLTTNLPPVPYDSGLGTAESASLSVDDLAFDLVVERGDRFGTPLTTRRLLNLVISLGGIGLFALLLQVNNDRARREIDRRRRESLLAAALEGAPGWTAVIDEDDAVLVGNTDPVGTRPGTRLVDAALLVDDETSAQRVVDLVDRARRSDVEPITVTRHPATTEEGMRIYEVLARRIGEPDPDNLVFLQAVDVTERRELAMRHAQSERMESIGVLAGSLAHDFNNLLFITQGYLQMMERQPQVANDAQLSRFVSRASEAVQRGATIAKSLLAVARSQPMAAVPVNMRQFIDDLEPLIRQAISNSPNVSLSIEVIDDSREHSERRDELDVLVDPGRMSSAVLNLVFNARDAMEHGGTLTVHAERRMATDTEGATREVIALSVRDTGKGMSPEVAARAYEPFFTTGKVGKGTGLGLAAVYSFAQQSNGWTTIDSREGAGTTVSIFLPPVITRHEPTPTAMTMTAERLRALVLDDEEALADLVASWLDDLGFETRVATSSAEAFTIAEEFRPQLLLSDSNLGEDLDGADVAARLSSDLSGLVTVFMTGFSDRMRSLETVGAMILAKPFSRDDLSAALIKVLGARFSASSPGTAASSARTAP